MTGETDTPEDHAMRDALLYGVGFMKDGERIDPREVYAEPKVDTSSEAVERLAAGLTDNKIGGELYSRQIAATLRALLARAEAAEARASEHGAYRSAASAFLATKGLSAEFDAWIAARGLEADAVGRLVEVANAVGRQMQDGEMPVSAEVEDAMCALVDVAPGILDQSPEG